MHLGRASRVISLDLAGLAHYVCTKLTVKSQRQPSNSVPFFASRRYTLLTFDRSSFI